MTITHIMLDTETWGKKPGCDQRSIGACVFDPATGFVHDGSLGTIRPFYQAVDNPDKYSLHRDPETVKWWADQSADAQAAFADPVDLADGLGGFSKWYATAAMHGSNICLWAHGPQFDCSNLAAAYDACGLPVPWHYRAPRDTRTIFDAAGITDHSAHLARFPGPLGILHHALDDAISQARAVCDAWARLRTGRYYRYTDKSCPGHVVDHKRCSNCGIHIDDLRP